MIASEYSFRLVSNRLVSNIKLKSSQPEISVSDIHKNTSEFDNEKRSFIKLAGVVGAGVVASQLLPRKAEALVMGGTPSTSVVGVKDTTNTRIDPAIKTGNFILKKTIGLSSSGIVHTPAAGKKIRIYNAKFSLSADMNSVGFRFTSGGTNLEYYYSPKTGGLYGSNNHPNYIEGGVDEPFYAVIDGTGTVQINMDYLEV